MMSPILKAVKQVSAEDLIDVVETLQSQGKLKPSLIFAALQEEKIGFLEADSAIAIPVFM